MTLENVLSPSDIFHPAVFYDDDWILGGMEGSRQFLQDNLYINSKVKNGKNLYLEFLEKYYYQPLTNYFDSEALSHLFYPKILLTSNPQTGLREVRFHIGIFAEQLLSGLLNADEALEKIQSMSATASNEEWITFLKDLCREDRKRYRDVQNRGELSPHYQDVYEIYQNYVKTMGKFLTFENFLLGKINASTKVIVGMKYCIPFFQKEIPIEPLLEAFDYDQFCLLTAKSSLEHATFVESLCQLVGNCIVYAKHYLNSVDLLRKSNPTYQVTIPYFEFSSHQKKMITIEDIRRELNAILARHPEFVFMSANAQDIQTVLKSNGLSEEEIQKFDASFQNNQELLSKLLYQLKAQRELAAEWEFIPKGKAERNHDYETSSSELNIAISEDERIRRMMISKGYLDDSDYLYKLYGMNKFEGYIAYIYPNSTVIFEKYYDNIRTKRVTPSSATYVMGLYNFLELSKMSKTEIIKIMKQDTSVNVKRIFHREDMNRWLSEIKRVITGSDYTQEVQNYIQTLLVTDEIKKNGVKE